MRFSLPSSRGVWRSWAVGVAFLLAACYAADPEWWQPSESPRLVRQTERFLWPSSPAAHSPETIKVLRQVSLWGVVGGLEADSQMVEPWEFSGTYYDGKVWVAIVTWRSGKKPAQQLKAGDETPGGHKIVEITEDRMHVRIGAFKNKQPMTLWIPLHQAAPVVY